MKNGLARVLAFPSARVGRPSAMGATRWDIWRGRLVELIGVALNRARIPGAVRDVTLKDSLTGQEVEIRVGVLSTRISVNGRDYYFDRITGKQNGAGTAL
jgi:hypothetical protein